MTILRNCIYKKWQLKMLGLDIKPITINSMQACVTFLKTLHVPTFVMIFKDSLKGEFMKVVKWFFDHIKQSDEKSYPQGLPKVNLMYPHFFVEEGGY